MGETRYILFLFKEYGTESAPSYHIMVRCDSIDIENPDSKSSGVVTFPSKWTTSSKITLN
jgi:hypothetical protein